MAGRGHTRSSSPVDLTLEGPQQQFAAICGVHRCCKNLGLVPSRVLEKVLEQGKAGGTRTNTGAQAWARTILVREDKLQG